MAVPACENENIVTPKYVIFTNHVLFSVGGYEYGPHHESMRIPKDIILKCAEKYIKADQE